MNSKHILDLTLRLSQALDQNYDVVNMEAVISVISALEGATITKEQLEATRLAKYINQLRRRTKSEQLARRAKSLLKKWREMVGIQQTNDSALSSNTSTTIISHNHRSQPTSPIVGKSLESNVNMTVRQGSGDFFRSTSSNPAVNLSLTGSASLNAINNKSLAVDVGMNISAVSMPSVPARNDNMNPVQLSIMDSVKQPISFANLLTSMSNNGAGSGEDLSNSPNSRKSIKRKERNSVYTSTCSKSLAVDQSSNSNIEFNRVSSMTNALPIANNAPIVIDIQDSNSGSNAISSMTPLSSITVGNTDSSIFKTKKSKKDKKRKEKEQQSQGSTSLPRIQQNASNVIGESCSIQKQAVIDAEYDKFVPIVDDKSRITYPISGISEILSLSNSSMNSMFPISNATSIPTGTGATTDQYKTEASINISNDRTLSKTLTVSDLTFAGKFNQQSSSETSDLFGFSGTGGNFNRTDVVYAVPSSEPQTTSPKVSSTNTFVPFSGSGCNSNDSSSNSRTSQFDIIDVVNQDNSQSRIISELRQQQKTQTTTDTHTPLIQQQKNSVVTTSSIETMLMPPALTTQTRIPITSGDSNIFPCENEQKIPKKRGRKKGSKGVDAVIAKETSLTAQMLVTSLGGKKVKTTRELFTEMQNRKLGVTSSPTLSNWLAHQQVSHISRPNSSCSEPSLHSPRTSDACSTNATISTVATRSTPDKIVGNAGLHEDEVDESESDSNTSDPSRDSATLHLQRKQSTDSNSNSYLVSKVSDLHSIVVQSQNSISADFLEQQIKQFLSQLPPIQPIDKIELECLEDIVPCTCKIIEIEPSSEPSENQQLFSDAKNDIHSENYFKSIKLPSDQQHMSMNNELLGINNSEKTKLLKHMVNTSQSVPPPPLRPKKSIFDLDFDDEDDPIHKFVAEATAKQEQKADISEVQSELVVKQDESFQSNNVAVEMLSDVSMQKTIIITDKTIVQEPSTILLPTYEVEEDSKCAAKERYEIQTQKITKFHITALHNCYIPNVNGNWDNAEITKKISSTSINFKKIETSESNVLSTDSLWENVVPQYGSLINEYLPKDLSHVHFHPNFKPKRRSLFEKRQYFVPFLGIARKNLKPEKPTLNLKNHVHKNCHKTSLIKKEMHRDMDAFASQVLDTENNNNDDNIFVQVENKLDNSELKLKSVEEETKNEYLFNDNTNLIHTHDNACTLSLVDSHQLTNQPLISSKTSRNKIFGGITIDIAEEHGVQSTDESTTHKTDPAATNLLTIVNLPKNTVTPKQSENTASDHSYKKLNDQNCNNNTAPILSFDVAEPVADIVDDKSISTSSLSIKNVGSRRSSSCSNSSLKQTQNSINLKLRRRRLRRREGNNLLDPCQKYGKKRRKKLKGGDGYSRDKINRVVKRLKIAINGDISTQRQVSIGSCTTDEEDGDDENDVYNGTGSKSSSFGEEMCEYKFGEYEGEEDDDDDDEQEEDDEEDYAGAYHEVVTRDLSATSTGNNHIVLTIKKTPSKTNSPSGSLSAISPNVTSTLSQNPVAKKIICLAKSIDCVKDCKNNTNTEPFGLLNSCAIGNNSEKLMALTNQLVPKNTSNISNTTANDDEECLNGDADIDMPTPSYSRLFRNCSKKLSSKSLRCSEKLHHQLFFPYELRTNDFEDSILNLSSCSSSCGEEKECVESENITEHYNQYNRTTDIENKTLVNNFSSISDPISSCSTYSETTCTSDHIDMEFSSCDFDGITNVVNSMKSENKNKEHTENVKSGEHLNDQESNGGSHQIEHNIIGVKHKSSPEDLNELSLENNGLLKSFNNIYVTDEQNQRFVLKLHSDDEDLIEDGADVELEHFVVLDDCERQKQQLQQVPNENCDVYSNFYNNNNNSKLDNSIKTMVRYSSNNNGSNSENIAATVENKDYGNINNDTQRNALTKATSSNNQLIPLKEYRTGLRAVDEDVNDDDGNNCARIQQFKEWHQVLQLRSYNDELLTVLPYVVLE